MKQFLLLFIFGISFSQNQSDAYYIDVQGFRGNVFKHTPEVSHLATGHPDGFLVSINKKSSGKKEWQQVYGYPDYGISFHYLDFKNHYLGYNVALGLHYNFYFFNRNLMFRISQGIGMTSNPYDKETNNKNNAFGTKFMDNNYFLLQYKKENIIDRIGLQAGFMLTHFSNGRIKSPNSGVNAYAINVGVSYNFEEPLEKQIDTLPKVKFTEPIKYNVVLRTGMSESPIIASGQKPFFHVGFYADKRLSRKSAIQLGTEIFLTYSYKEFIKYQSIAYPEENVTTDTDFKRGGIFVGYELFINRISLEAQLGFYVYQPYKSDIPVYDRLGMKYYITKKIYTGLSVKTHIFLAEAMEFVVGVRL